MEVQVRGMREALVRHPLPWKSAHSDGRTRIVDANGRTIFMGNLLDTHAATLASAVTMLVNDLLSQPEQSGERDHEESH